VITVPPSLTVSPTASMGPAVGLPGKPELWEGTGELGAKAAAVWFLRDLYRYVLETNDTAEWERLSTDDCEFCANKVDQAAEVEDSGYAFRQDGAARVAVERVEELNPLSYAVLVRIDQLPVQTFSRDGVWQSEYVPDAAQFRLILHREGPDWLMYSGAEFDADADVPSLLDQP